MATKRRSDTERLIDVLNTVKEGGVTGVIISKVVTDANIAYNYAVEFCEPLVEKGLLECILDNNRTYRITQKGVIFLETLIKLNKSINGMGDSSNNMMLRGEKSEQDQCG